MDTKKEIEEGIKTDYRAGNFFPKDYITPEEEAWIKEFKLQNELDYLKELEERKKRQEIIDNYNSKYN